MSTQHNQWQKGDKVSTYTLLEKIGEGRFAVVWKARNEDKMASHFIALKLFIGQASDSKQVLREANAWLEFSHHPHIIHMYEAEDCGDQALISMEFVEDGNLEQWRQRNHSGGVIPVDTAVQLGIGILVGLQHIHSKGHVHRDLKPENILMRGDTPKIGDFGLARDTNVTWSQNSAAGTPLYMPPEAFLDGKKVDERSDLWAVAVILFRLVSGIFPFYGGNLLELQPLILNEPPPPLPPDVTPEVKNVILKALSKDPASRYTSAEEMKRALEGALQPVRSHREDTERIGNENQPTTRDGPRFQIPWSIYPVSELLPAISLAILLNVVVAHAVFRYSRGLLFLDTIGTCCVALRFGPWYGVVCGALSNVLLQPVFGIESRYQDFAIVNAALGFYWGCLTCRKPRLSGDPGVFSANRWPFIGVYGVLGAIVSTVLVATIKVCFHGLSITQSNENDLTLYGVIKDLSPNLWDGISYSISLMTYNMPDKVTSSYLALVLVTYFMPLYNKNARFLGSTRVIVSERQGPWAAFAAGLLLCWVHYYTGATVLALCWLPVICCVPFWLLNHRVRINSPQRERVESFARECRDLGNILAEYRRERFKAVKSSGYKVFGLIGYYLLCLLLLSTLEEPRRQFTGVPLLTRSIWSVTKIIALIWIITCLAFWVVSDNIAYLESLGRKGDEAREE
jgi:tRNA A-37 threonylcarbamoyl transferase component Bud32